MRVHVFCLLAVATGLTATTEELFVTKTGNDFVIEGKYTNSDVAELADSEFWICVDYEASTPVLYDSRPYPTDLCGGEPQTANNTWWYGVHGRWSRSARLTIFFEGATQVWPETGSEYPGGRFTWNRNAAESQNDLLRLIQSHGVTNFGAKDLNVDMADLVGSGSVHVRGVADGRDLHVRVNGVGFTLQQTYETENARTSEEESAIVDNDVTTTSEPLEGVQEMPKAESKSKGVQSRPIDDVPVFDDAEPRAIVYDYDTRGVIGIVMPNDTDGEIVEIDVESQDNQQTTIVASIDKSEVEGTSLPVTTTESAEILENVVNDRLEADALMAETQQEKIVDYQLFYTLAVSAALGCLGCFVFIVIFRCFAWGRRSDDKSANLPTMHTPRPLVYTIAEPQRGHALP